MIDVQHVHLTLDLVAGARARVANPLGTTFDLAEIAVLPAGRKLDAGPFLRSRTEDADRILATCDGIWLVAVEETVEVGIGRGDRRAAHDLFGELGPEALDAALFHQLPDDLFGLAGAGLAITLICMN